MIHTIYKGGNRLNTNYEPVKLSGNTADRVEYAAHLKTRHRVLAEHFDQGHTDNNRYLKAADPASRGGLAVGDSLELHLLGEGTLVDHIVFENKRALPGAAVLVRLQGVDSNTPIAVTIDGETYSQDDSTDEDAPLGSGEDTDPTPDDTSGGEDTGDIITLSIPLDNVGWTRLAVPAGGVLLQDEGLVSVDVTALPTDTPSDDQRVYDLCFTLYTSLIHFDDGKLCSCVEPPCETDFPPANCIPGIVG